MRFSKRMKKMKKIINLKSIAALFAKVAVVALLVVPPIGNADDKIGPQGVPAILNTLVNQVETLQENQEQMYACLVDRGACATSGMPDLVPLTRSGSLPVPLPGVDEGLCNIDDAGLFVLRVKNQGTATADSSRVVLFFRHSDVLEGRLSTVPALLQGETADVLVPFDDIGNCFNSDCSFQISIYYNGGLDESDYRNNSAYGKCIG
ncbi:MAG: hypothetical protein RPR97_00220 [Colwellia sp.]